MFFHILKVIHVDMTKPKGINVDIRKSQSFNLKIIMKFEIYVIEYPTILDDLGSYRDHFGDFLKFQLSLSN
jgi:hypothetical protein